MMKKTRLIVVMLVTLSALMLPSISSAVTRAKTRAQARLMARRAAISDAQRNLAETIYGIRLDSHTTVRDFIAKNDEIRTRVDAVLRGARVTKTRWEEDGTCTVKMEVPVISLQRALQRRFAYFGDVIRATGQGAPNPLEPKPTPKNTPPPEESWYNLIIKATGYGAPPPKYADTPRGKLMAERAAYADAMRQLGENIKGVHVTGNTTVGDFVTQSDKIRTEFHGFLRGAKKVETRHLEDGTCEVDVEIPLNGLKPLVERAHRRHRPHPQSQSRHRDRNPHQDY